MDKIRATANMLYKLSESIKDLKGLLRPSFVCVFILTRNYSADPSSRAVCGLSLAGIAGSNPAGDMDVCLLWVLCVLR